MCGSSVSAVHKKERERRMQVAAALVGRCEGKMGLADSQYYSNSVYFYNISCNISGFILSLNVKMVCTTSSTFRSLDDHLYLLSFPAP